MIVIINDTFVYGNLNIILIQAWEAPRLHFAKLEKLFIDLMHLNARFGSLESATTTKAFYLLNA